MSDVGTDESVDGGEAPDDAGPDDEVQELLDGLDFGEGAARVTVGDTTYEFALGGTSTVGSTTYVGVCQQLFGLMAGSGYDNGGRAITVDFEMPPVDWESYADGRLSTSSPRLKVEDVQNGVSCAADQSLVELSHETAGLSQIDEWVTDGSRASVTATFIELEPWSAPVEAPWQGSGVRPGRTRAWCDMVCRPWSRPWNVLVSITS